MSGAWDFGKLPKVGFLDATWAMVTKSLPKSLQGIQRGPIERDVDRAHLRLS